MVHLVSKKRVRSPNFTPEDKLLLLNIIQEHKEVIESKTTGGATWRDKENAWQFVTNKFNASNVTKRSTDSLKTLYENTKKSAKQNTCLNRANRTQTGGGPCTKPEIDPVLELTMSIINKKTALGFMNKFDGDGRISSCAEPSSSVSVEESEENHDLHKDELFLQQITGENAVDEILSNNDVVMTIPVTTVASTQAEPQKENADALDWGNYKVGHLQTPVQEKLQSVKKKQAQEANWRSRRRPILKASLNLSRTYEDLAGTRIEIYKVQLNMVKEEDFKLKKMKAELENDKRRREQQDQIFELEKQKLELSIEIQKAQLEKLNSM